MSRLKYSETEKVLLLRSYLESSMDAKNFSRSRGVPYTTFRYICKQYGTPDLSTIERLMKETKIPNTVDELQSQLSNERKAYEAEIKRLKKALSESELRCLANSTMIDLAEKMFNIPIRKKTRCQVINTLSQSQEADTSARRNVSFLCNYLGISRQGYYKYIVQEKEEEILGTSIVLYATELRKDLPKAGMRELYELCRRKFQDKFLHWPQPVLQSLPV